MDSPTSSNFAALRPSVIIDHHTPSNIFKWVVFLRTFSFQNLILRCVDQCLRCPPPFHQYPPRKKLLLISEDPFLESGRRGAKWVKKRLASDCIPPECMFSSGSQLASSTPSLLQHAHLRLFPLGPLGFSNPSEPTNSNYHCQQPFFWYVLTSDPPIPISRFFRHLSVRSWPLPSCSLRQRNLRLAEEVELVNTL